MNVMRSLTKAEQVLLAAADLERRGVRPFSSEDLVVEAWRKYRDAFALKGYPRFPDSNRVYAELMGSKPLRSRGWILKTGTKQYQLSEAGRIAADNLRGTRPGASSVDADLPRGQQMLLARLLSSRAVRKARADALGSMIFPDACSFWEISSRTVASTLKVRVSSVEAVLKVVEELIRRKGALVLTSRDMACDQEDLRMLKDTHTFLLETFAPELDLIRARKDERLGS